MVRHCLILVLVVGCGSGSGRPIPVSNGLGPAPYDPDTAYAPRVTPADLGPDITNPLFPGAVGTRWVYEAQTDEGVERIEVEVLPDTREVWGVTARVIRDTVYLDGEMIEDTWDWYAQDGDGNVWYMGEETYEYRNGMRVCDCGSWEAGVGGALPGVVMLGSPEPGIVYRQEFLDGEAEDIGIVVETGLTVTGPTGTFSGCIRTNDRSAVELSADEYKTYCPGIGTFREEEQGEVVELIELHRPPA